MLPSNKEPVLAACELSISYGHQEVVKKVSFTVDYGEVVAIVGASGSGKSTLLHSAAGLLPDNGRITFGDWLFRGQSVKAMSARMRRNLRGTEMAMLFQHPGEYLNPTMKISEQYRDFLFAHGADKKTWRERAEASLKKAGLAEAGKVMKCIPSELSGGMRQKVAAAMTLEFDPVLLLVDEPTAALDSIATWQLLKRLRQRIDDRHSLLLVTHDMRAATFLADRILVMQEGEMVANGTKKEIKAAPEGSYAWKLWQAVPELR